MKTHKSLQQILVASTLIGLLITPNAAMAGKLKFGRSNSFSRQSSTSNRNLKTKSMTTNSANTFKPQGKGSVSKTQMKSSVVKTKSSRQSRLSATPKLQPSNNLKKQGISNRTLPKLTNKGNGRKMSLGSSQSFLGQQKSLRTSPGTFPPKNNGSLRVMPSKSKGAANAMRSMQPAVILPRKGKKGSSTLSSSRGKFDGSKSTQLLRPIRPGSLQLVKPGKGAATNSVQIAELLIKDYL